jgi:hypothetical protein
VNQATSSGDRLLIQLQLLLLLLSLLYPSSKSSSIFFSDDNIKAVRNQIIVINSFNKLSSLSMRTNQGDSDRGTNTTQHQGANTL